ncbi:DUF4867 family protein [Metabacillus arenae]|uniref:DUF4867 family protein n=1 Tax=Metabacillus arenae TaxID=2771434 RepID=A0A926NKC8_9BACI|nr:DUF4867 family protein [Metabacillus arenae]MBD1381563.1 DUF4867 family protein [Metabacillus arenae]
MVSYELIKKKNLHLNFHHISDRHFQEFGKIIENYDVEELKTQMEKTDIPQEGNRYVASDSQLESTKFKGEIQTSFYGNMPVQIGYCNGRNSTLNGLEYHKGSEINIAITDLVLLLGRVQDIENCCYNANDVSAFFIPAGTVLELYGTTLHFAPCKVEEIGFKTIVILPEGTNQPLEEEFKKYTPEDRLLFMRNKWLIAHPERDVLINKGAYPGIKGENIEVYY